MAQNVSDPTQQPAVNCPKCGTPVLLTEALAAPLLAATRAEYEAKLSAQNESLARQQKELEDKQAVATETSLGRSDPATTTSICSRTNRIACGSACTSGRAASGTALPAGF